MMMTMTADEGDCGYDDDDEFVLNTNDDVVDDYDAYGTVVTMVRIDDDGDDRDDDVCIVI